ncbi:cysteine desulfurase/sulfurtransferase TusA family protein [Nocardioides sp. AN3]
MTSPAVYLDAASAEPLHPAALAVLSAAHERGYADPRRLHGPGRDARLLLDNAREVVAESLGVRRDEVMFTSSGTAAVHAGVAGLAVTAGAGGIVTSAVEHQSVTDAAQWIAQWLAQWVSPQVAQRPAMEVVEAPVDRLGRVDLDEMSRLASGAALVALQQANHEVGTVQPVAELAATTSGPLFVDACASMGRLPLPDGWTALAGSARKWGGPGGVGVLLVRKGASWTWPFPGDPHGTAEQGFTNVAGALAAAAALQAMVAERDEVGSRQRELIDLVRAGVTRIPDVDLVGDPVDRLPHLVTFSCLYVDGEALVTELDRRGFGIASGSACAVDTREPSRVLGAMGALTHGNVRLSLARDATRDDVERFLAVLPDVVRALRAEVAL